MPNNLYQNHSGQFARFIFRFIHVIPVAMAMTLLVLLFFSWRIIASEDDQRLRVETNGHLQHFSTQIHSHFETRFSLAKLIQSKWRKEQINSKEDFEREALEIHNLYPDFQAINWINTDRVITWVVPFEENKGALGLDISKLKAPNAALENAIATNEVKTTPPIKLAQGGIGFVGYLPLYQDGKINGFLNLVFRTRPAVNAAVNEEFLKRFHLNIFDGDRSLLPEVQDNSKAPFVLTNEINVGSRIWRIEVSPNPSEIDQRRTYLENFYLIFGLTFIILVTILVRALLNRQISLANQEKRFKDLATISSDWFWETDADLRFSYVSPRYTELTGDSVKDKLGKRRWELAAGSVDDPEWREHINDLKNHRPFKNFEYASRTPSGKLIHYRLSGVPVYDPNGQFTGYRGSGSDITKIKTAELLRQAALNEAEAANKAKSEFLATMSHELRTPLNAIIGFSDVLKNEMFGPLPNDKYCNYAHDIYASGEHLLGLINDILDISAIEAGKRHFQQTDCDLVEITDESIRSIRPLAEAKGIKLDYIHKEPSMPIRADSRALRQIIINLTSNAIKFNKPDGSVKITTGFKLDEPHIAEIIVEDTGIGIPEKDQKRILEPFRRGQSDPHISQEGTGLGLSIVSALVDMHNGSITIDSIEGEGTTIKISLEVGQRG
ncbi:MAG: ATP-binding protein, partial [Alphaproteobacteria bacterium]|nr:ATP-binding protein [Alphaproteobacteria bacterium]